MPGRAASSMRDVFRAQSRRSDAARVSESQPESWRSGLSFRADFPLATNRYPDHFKKLPIQPKRREATVTGRCDPAHILDFSDLVIVTPMFQSGEH